MAEKALKELNEQIKLRSSGSVCGGLHGGDADDSSICRKSGSERTSVEAVSTRRSGASAGAGTVATSEAGSGDC